MHGLFLPMFCVCIQKVTRDLQIKNILGVRSARTNQKQQFKNSLLYVNVDWTQRMNFLVYCILYLEAVRVEHDPNPN